MLNARDYNEKIGNTMFGASVWMIKVIITLKVHNNYTCRVKYNIDTWECVKRNLRLFLSFNMDFSLIAFIRALNVMILLQPPESLAGSNSHPHFCI